MFGKIWESLGKIYDWGHSSEYIRQNTPLRVGHKVESE